MADQEEAGDIHTAVAITERAIQALLQRLEERAGVRVLSVELCTADITLLRDARRVLSQYVVVQLDTPAPERRWVNRPAASSTASGPSVAALAEYRRRISAAGLDPAAEA